MFLRWKIVTNCKNDDDKNGIFIWKGKLHQFYQGNVKKTMI